MNQVKAVSSCYRPFPTPEARTYVPPSIYVAMMFILTFTHTHTHTHTACFNELCTFSIFRVPVPWNEYCQAAKYCQRTIFGDQLKGKDYYTGMTWFLACLCRE